MDKKWIKKAEITKILNTYSVRKDEFEQVSNINYCYKSTLINGYIVKMEQGQEDDIVLVLHTRTNGKRQFTDVWKRDETGKLQFCFRNLPNAPLSDASVIQELELKIAELQQAGRELTEKNRLLELENQKLINERTPTPHNANYIGELEREVIQVKTANRELKEQNHKLINDIAEKTKHNARNAGRKPSDERKKAIERTRTLLESGASNQDVMKELKISRATFFRYKKSISNSKNK